MTAEAAVLAPAKDATPPGSAAGRAFSVPQLQVDASSLSVGASMLLSPKSDVSGRKFKTSAVTFTKAGSPKPRNGSTLLTRSGEVDPGHPSPSASVAVGMTTSASSARTTNPVPAAVSPSAAAAAAATTVAGAGSASVGVTESRHPLTSSLTSISPSALGIPSANLAALLDTGGTRSASPSAAIAKMPSGPLSAAAATQGSLNATGRSTSGNGATSASAAEASATSPTGGRPGSKPGAAAVPSRPGSRLCTPIIQNLSLDDAGGKRQVGSSHGKPAGGSGGGGLLAKRPHPMQDYKPSRAQLLQVFNALDSSKSGKITQSVMEEACLSLGFSLQGAHSLFERLDTRKKGFITPSEWGARDFSQTIEAFSLMYLRRFLGLPDVHASPVDVQKYYHSQQQKQIKSLPIAVNLMKVNAMTRGAHSALNCGDVLYNAFAFIDTDNSGNLSKKELIDGFFVMGVNICDVVADEIMKLFDRDGNGTVEYHEFLKTMFKGQT